MWDELGNMRLVVSDDPASGVVPPIDVGAHAALVVALPRSCP
jgi:hypothetical protein